MSTVIGNLRVVLGLDATAFQKGLADATSRLRAVGRGMANIGRSMTVGVTAPIAAFGGLSLKAAGDFEAAMNRVRAATGASAAEMEGLEAIALKMGETTQFKASDAAGAIEMLAKNGLDASQILGGALEASMLLAAASGADLASSGDLATDVMLQFGKQAADMTGLVDGMTGVMLASKFGFDDYRLAIAQAGGVAGGLGVSFEDFNAAIAGTSSLFASGSDAGTSFKTFLQRLVPSSSAAAAQMEQLGLEFFDAQGNMKAMAEIAQELQDGLAGLSDEARNDALSKIFGTDAMRTAIGLAEQGAAGIDRLRVTIGEASATEQATARLEGFNGQMTQLKSGLEALMIAIGNSGILEWATQIAQWLTEVARRLKDTNPEMLRLGIAIGAVAAVLGPTLAGIGMMLIGLGPLLTGIKLVAIAAAAMGGPFTLAAAAIAAVATAIYLNWDSVGPWFKTLIDSLGQVATGFVQLLTGIFTGDMSLAITGLKAIWDGFSTYWKTLWDGVAGVITWAWETFIKPVTDALGVTDEIEAAWNAVRDMFDTTLSAIANAFDAAWKRIEPFLEKIQGAWGKMDSLYQRATGANKDGPISSGPSTGSATGPIPIPQSFYSGEDVAAGLQNGTTGMRDQGAADADAYSEGFREGMGIQSPSKVMEEAGHYIMQGLSNGILSEQPAVIEQTQSLGDEIKSSITSQLDGIIRGTVSVKDAFASMLQDMSSRLLSSGVNTLVDNLFGAFSPAGWGGVWGNDALSQALRAIPGFATGGMHSGGFRIVGEHGPELEATGAARYFSAPRTAAMMGGAQQVHVTVGVDPRNGSIAPYVDGRVNSRVARSDQQFPSRWAAVQREKSQRYD